MVKFSKMHGCGNSFIVIDDFRQKVSSPARLARQLCDYRKGIGADGLILARPSRRADARMAYWNADGSIAEMCGNGIRCLTKFLVDSGYLRESTASIETGAGIKHTSLVGKRRSGTVNVLVDMGPPTFTSRDLARAGTGPHLNLRIRDRLFSFVSMGNPHAVTFVQDQTYNLSKEGPQIENFRKLFPNKTNVEFVQIVQSRLLRVRVWERGCGITAACGTGACASAVAAILTARAPRKPLTVKVDGGELGVTWRSADDHVLMQGEAVTVAEGLVS